MTLSQRAEVSLTGFLLQDLWGLLASRRESRLGLKKGTCQLAGQTRSNLQSIALSVVSMCWKKDETWTPFAHPKSLSEINIEQMFGRFRASSSSGDLHCRSYWSASAAVARSELTKLQNVNKKFGPRGNAEIVPGLTTDEFLSCKLKACARRAWNASIQLVAASSEYSTSDIETLYRLEAVSDDFLTAVLEEEEFESVERMESAQNAGLEHAADKTGLKTILGEIEHSMSDHLLGKTEEEDVAHSVKPADRDLQLPDGHDIVHLTAVSDEQILTEEKESNENLQLPRTLMDALSLEHSLKEMRLEDDEVMQGQKGSRLSKWIAACDARREAMGVPGAPKPEALQNRG
eukprot:Skav219174  [mRNA]  locus=scaffold648:376986:378912:- [translate_table: standard]